MCDDLSSRFHLGRQSNRRLQRRRLFGANDSRLHSGEGKKKTIFIPLFPTIFLLLSQLGAAPRILNTIKCCPVDFVSSAIIHVATHCLRDGRHFGKTFHFCNPDLFRFSTIFQSLRDFGYDIELEEYVTWRDRLQHYTLKKNDHALFPLLHFILDDLPNKSKNPELDSRNLRSLFHLEVFLPFLCLLLICIMYVCGGEIVCVRESE